MPTSNRHYFYSELKLSPHFQNMSKFLTCATSKPSQVHCKCHTMNTWEEKKNKTSLQVWRQWTLCLLSGNHFLNISISKNLCSSSNHVEKSHGFCTASFWISWKYDLYCCSIKQPDSILLHTEFRPSKSSLQSRNSHFNIAGESIKITPAKETWGSTAALLTQ